MDFFIGLLILAFAGFLFWLLAKLNHVADLEAQGDFSSGQSWLNKIRRNAVVQSIVAALRKLFR